MHGAVDDADHGQHHGHGAEVEGGVREQRHQEADQAVGADLEQQAGQDHGAGGGRLGVRVGQPGVHGERRQLHGEGGEEAQHEPGGRGRRHRRAQQLRVVEGEGARGALVDEVQGQDGDQHQQAADLREDEELDGGVDAALVAPHRDEEVHGHQHHLPEEVEQEQVEGQEDAGQAGQGPQQDEVEEADALLDALPARPARPPAPGTVSVSRIRLEAVHGQVEADAELRDPGALDVGQQAARKSAAAGPLVGTAAARSPALAIHCSTTMTQRHAHAGHGRPARRERARRPMGQAANAASVGMSR